LCHVSSEWSKYSLIQFMQLQKADPSLAQQRVQEHALLLRSLGMTALGSSLPVRQRPLGRQTAPRPGLQKA